MKKLTLREIQLEEKKILDIAVNVFEKYSINYYLWGGTVLGAIRHKGFIPWDDDIDLFMPRPDYDRLINLIKNNKNLFGKNMYAKAFELNNSYYPILKIYNKNIAIENDLGIDNNLWIDIFPIDGVSKSNFIVKMNYRRSLLYRKLFMTSLMSQKFIENNDNFLKSKLRLIIKKIYDGKEKKLVSKIIKLSRKYDFNKCQKVGVTVWSHIIREVLDKDMLKVKKVEFEGTIYNGFEGQEYFLNNSYGDFMTLPPEEKRINHKIIAYKLRGDRKRE